MRLVIAGLVVLLPLSSSLFAADHQMREGLWEMHLQSEALKNMPNIPPQHLEQMRQRGIDVPKIDNNSIVTKVCIPKEMAGRPGVPVLDKHDTGCEIENYKRSGKNYSANIVCDGPQMKGKGVVEGNMESPERFQSVYDFDGTIEGRAVKHQQTSSGKWISADCGSVRPLTEMGKK